LKEERKSSDCHKDDQKRVERKELHPSLQMAPNTDRPEEVGLQVDIREEPGTNPRTSEKKFRSSASPQRESAWANQREQTHVREKGRVQELAQKKRKSCKETKGVNSKACPKCSALDARFPGMIRKKSPPIG